MSKRDVYKEAMKVREITLKYDVKLIINDYIEIALAVDADGVHLGEEDMPLREARKIMGGKKIIGISTHNLRQAGRAEYEGADYIGFGPMFPTATKDAGHPQGLRRLSAIRKRINIPIVAIGGITWENVKEVLNAGADYAAVASGILSGDIKENTVKYLKALC